MKTLKENGDFCFSFVFQSTVETFSSKSQGKKIDGFCKLYLTVIYSRKGCLFSSLRPTHRLKYVHMLYVPSLAMFVTCVNFYL